VIGLLQRDPDEFLQGNPLGAALSANLLTQSKVTADLTVLSKTDIESKISERQEAKKSKNFAKADFIRKELADAGIILEDSPQGTTWRRA
jgi:cysteinyl-tRNA synthetase